MQGDDDNPYRSPASVVAEVHVARAIVDAGRWRRFFNLVLDQFAIMLGLFVAMLIAAIAGGDEAIEWMEAMGFWQEQLLGIGLMLAYYIVMEGLFGLTIGKWITGTRVVDDSGGPPTWRQAVLRSLARLIPFEPFSVLFSDDGAARGWHDSLPRTRVVLRRSLQPTGTQARVVV
ncbi:MAG TPA: RDD family protein [Thermomonas sp.]|nr:RDD family protein [Thermomonas sp.]